MIPSNYPRLTTLKKIEQWFSKDYRIFLALLVAVPIVMTIISWGER